MKNLDILDFRLQATGSTIIATILVNNIPLYDYIICKHAEYSFENEEDKKTFFAESYNFEMQPVENLEEEILFYYNFPENLMPIDPKHTMIGFSPRATFYLLYEPFVKSNELCLTKEELEDEEYDNDEGVICLVHTCGSVGCSCIYMKVDENTENKTIVLHSFRDSCGLEYDSKIKFTFEKDQYFEVLKRLKISCDNSTNYEEYQKFQTERFYKENAHLFEK